MIDLEEKLDKVNGVSAVADAGIDSCFIVNKAGQLVRSCGCFDNPSRSLENLLSNVPALREHLANQDASGAFYKTSREESTAGGEIVYIGRLPRLEDMLIVSFDSPLSLGKGRSIKPEIFILSLITQAVRAFHRAGNLDDILKIVLIGVTAGSGLGFNRAFAFLTCNDKRCLKGALAHGPSSPEEAGVIWEKLSSGELTLRMMFDDVLQKNKWDEQPINELLKDLKIPLDNKDNIFARAALENKSIIIDQSVLKGADYDELRERLGPGPLALVPLVGEDSLQGVLIADNSITQKKITKNDLHLLEIFARYASDSIERFCLQENLEKKVEALKRANETIILSRENLIKAERLSVFAEMAGQVAHEIRNPLTVIGGFTKATLRKMAENDENYENLNMIVGQVKRIEKVLEKFSSLVNMKKKNEQILDLGEMIRSTVAIRTPGFNFVRFDVRVEQPVTIIIDPDLFRQALWIIIKKADMIQKCNDLIALSVRKSDQRGIIYFEPSCHKRWFTETIYKSFISIGDHQTRKELSTALEILKYYGGNIGIEAKDDDDIRFYLELPVYKEER